MKLEKKIDIIKNYVNRVIEKKDGVVNKIFLQMMEALEYDFEVT